MGQDIPRGHRGLGLGRDKNPDAGFAVVGTSSSWGDGSSAMILRLDGSSNLSWARRVPGSGAYAVAVAGDNGIVVAGTSGFSLLKTDASGNLLWVTRLASLTPRSLVILPDGRISGAGTYSSDFCLFRVFPDGAYPNCFLPVTPVPVDVTPVVSISTSNPTQTFVNVAWNPTVTMVTLGVSQICSPVEIGEGYVFLDEEIKTAGLTGAALFISPLACRIRIYGSDGRLVYSGNLKQGENRVSLDQGVYLYVAGGQMGKVAVLD